MHSHTNLTTKQAQLIDVINELHFLTHTLANLGCQDACTHLRQLYGNILLIEGLDGFYKTCEVIDQEIETASLTSDEIKTPLVRADEALAAVNQLEGLTQNPKYNDLFVNSKLALHHSALFSSPLNKSDNPLESLFQQAFAFTGYSRR